MRSKKSFYFSIGVIAMVIGLSVSSFLITNGAGQLFDNLQNDTDHLSKHDVQFISPDIISQNHLEKYFSNASHSWQHGVFLDDAIIFSGNNNYFNQFQVLAKVQHSNISHLVWHKQFFNIGRDYDLKLSPDKKSVYWLIGNMSDLNYYSVLLKISVIDGEILWRTQLDEIIKDEGFCTPQIYITDCPENEILVAFNTANPENSEISQIMYYGLNSDGTITFKTPIVEENKSIYVTDIIYDTLTKITAISGYISNGSGEYYSKILFFNGKEYTHQITWKKDILNTGPEVQYYIRGLCLSQEENYINKLLPLNSYRSRLFAIMTTRNQSQPVYNLYIATIPLYEQIFLSVLDLNKIDATKVYVGAIQTIDFKVRKTKSTNYLSVDYHSIFIQIQTGNLNLTHIEVSCDTHEVVKEYVYNPTFSGITHFICPKMHFDLDGKLIITTGLKIEDQSFTYPMVAIFSPDYFDPFANVEPTPFYIWAVLPLMFVPFVFLLNGKRSR